MFPALFSAFSPTFSPTFFLRLKLCTWPNCTSGPACTLISNTRPTCQPQLGQRIYRSHPLLLSPRLGLLLVSSLSSAVRAALGGSPRARFDRGIPPCNLTISTSSSSLLGGCRRQKEKGTVYAQRKAGFSNKPAGGPFPSRPAQLQQLPTAVQSLKNRQPPWCQWWFSAVRSYFSRSTRSSSERLLEAPPLRAHSPSSSCLTHSTCFVWC